MSYGNAEAAKARPASSPVVTLQRRASTRVDAPRGFSHRQGGRLAPFRTRYGSEYLALDPLPQIQFY